MYILPVFQFPYFNKLNRWCGLKHRNMYASTSRQSVLKNGHNYVYFARL